MANLMRYRVAWTGTPVVGGGLSTFYFADGTAPAAIPTNTKALFTAIKGLFNSGITWNFPNGGDIINDADGALVGSWTGGAATTEVGSTANPYAAGVGCIISWNTTGIHRRRRVKGRSFLVPLLSNQYDFDGTILNTAVTTIQNAATALATSSTPLVIWSRPHKGAADGASFAVTAATAMDKVATLKSRRT
jgi:hypothetical protein